MLGMVHQSRMSRSPGMPCETCDQDYRGWRRPSSYWYCELMVTADGSDVGTHVGKRTAVIIPAGHGLVGKVNVWGSRVLSVSKQVNVIWRNLSSSSFVLALTSPTNMRKPWNCQETLFSMKRKTHWLESSDFRSLLEVVQAVLHVVYRHTTLHTFKSNVLDLWYAFVGSITSFEISTEIRIYRDIWRRSERTVWLSSSSKSPRWTGMLYRSTLLEGLSLGPWTHWMHSVIVNQHF